MSRYRETMAETLKRVYEDGHEDVSSSKRMCQTIIEDATQIRTKLDSMSAEDKLDTWWTNKLAKSADNLNSARDYIMNPIEESLQNYDRGDTPFIIRYGKDNVAKAMQIAKTSGGKYTIAAREIEKIGRNLSKAPSIAKELQKQNEEIDFDLTEGRMKDIYTMQQDGKSAKEIAKLMKLPVKTVRDILGEEDLEEKIKPFMLSYSKGGTHAGFEDANTLPELQKKAQELRRKGFTIDKMGRYNPPVGDMFMKKFARKEEVELVEFSDAMLNKLAREYEPLRGKTMSVQQANKLRQIFNMVPDRALDALRRKKIPFLSGLALSRMIQKGMPVKEQVENDKEKKETDNKDSVIAALKDQVAMLKQKLENEKNKAVKPEPNPETGEVPLTIGLANKLLKDKEMKKEAFTVQITKKDGGKLVHGKYKTKADADKFVKWYKTGDMKDTKSIKVIQEADLTKPQIKKVHKMADELPKKDFKDRYGKEKGDAVRYATATNIVKKKLGIEGKDMKNEEMRLRVEAIAGLKKKAEKSGMPYSILKKVYDRGMAAWKGGHRPGASQQQWAFARVN